MGNKHITAGRLTAAAWAAVLAPAAGMLPGVAARRAGMGAWLAPLVVLPAVLLLGQMLGKLTARRNLAQTMLQLLGRPVGGLLTIIYIAWAWLLASARLRLSGQRLLFTAQREMEPWLCLAVVTALAAWLALRKAEAFVRAAALFSKILTLALVAVLGLTVFQLRAENLFALWAGDVLPVLKAAVPTLGVLCVGAYAAFLWEGESEHAGGWKRRAAGSCGLLSLLQLSVLGNMGAELTAALEDPFITLSKHVGVEGAFQRVESLVSALWLLGDLSFLGLLLWACRRMVQVLLPQKNTALAAPAGAAAVLVGSGLVFRDAMLAQQFEYLLAPLGNLVLGGGVPLGLFLLSEVRKRTKGNGTSCAL